MHSSPDDELFDPPREIPDAEIYNFIPRDHVFYFKNTQTSWRMGVIQAEKFRIHEYERFGHTKDVSSVLSVATDSLEELQLKTVYREFYSFRLFHHDPARRNIIWDEGMEQCFIVDLEDVEERDHPVFSTPRFDPWRDFRYWELCSAELDPDEANYDPMMPGPHEEIEDTDEALYALAARTKHISKPDGNVATKAHTHARNAVLETRKSNPVAASEEHDLAAGEFAAAAQKSSDREVCFSAIPAGLIDAHMCKSQALRTLQLLEQHHKKLAQILRFQHENPPAAAPGTQQVTVESGGGKTDTQQHPPKLLGHARLPARETSSIASNLASARGIPSQPRRGSPVSPTVSSQQAGAKMTEGPAKIRTSEARLRERQAYATKERSNRTPSKQSWNPPAASPTDITSQQFVPPDAESSHPKDRQATSEEPFQRFYSTFEGLISKLSAPLAFAGLPLGSDVSEKADSARKTSADTKVDRQPAVSDRQSQPGDTDISRIFSRAALRAVRDSTGGGTGSTAESFYVVPTTGGTVSYAGILSRAEKEARRSSFEEGDEDFVDARETPPSPEMRQSMTGSKGRGSRGKDKLTSIQSPKTLEELQMENQALKHLTDTLSKRLHMWEVNAQSSSMALQQSLRAMHHQNVPSPEHFPQSTPAVASPIAPLPTPASADQEQRIRELEELIQQSEKELDKVGRENDKLRNVVGRYRDRWEKLKEGAKTRREGRSTADRNSYAEPSTPVRTGSTSTQKASETTQVQAEGAAENDTNSSNEPEVKNDSSS
ncbi:hypothetical protein BDV35DRAFT_377509 [Aspergillus flavus]|uniref:Uncharacterized protein n=1 Tax=Aspergillus flavus TaxID=5059 RepID=A0A5N6HAI9_ASPFL|nr:hypothetical protein BDV35DRAFT_377509 [Aspergillus flavus]